MIKNNVTVRHEKPIYGTNIGISVNVHWRQLPPVLHELKSRNCSIEKAKYWQSWTSMYIKSPSKFLPMEIDNMIMDSLTGETSTLYSPGLPFNTKIYIYNISTCPYTVMDFGCRDRTGLFCEILEVLSRYDIDVKAAYINTIGNVVSNIFYITHNDVALTEDYIEYIRNNLEAEVKTRDSDSY